MFNAEEIAQQDVITSEDGEGKIVAFLNIIPDYAPEECTYDLIRKTGAAYKTLLIFPVYFLRHRPVLPKQ